MFYSVIRISALLPSKSFATACCR